MVKTQEEIDALSRRYELSKTICYLVSVLAGVGLAHQLFIEINAPWVRLGFLFVGAVVCFGKAKRLAYEAMMLRVASYGDLRQLEDYKDYFTDSDKNHISKVNELGRELTKREVGAIFQRSAERKRAGERKEILKGLQS